MIGEALNSGTNMTKNRLLRCLVFLMLSLIPTRYASSAEAVVHAVLFYSPNCGHCHIVITEVLPPLFEQYGEQLTIVGVDITQPDGQVLFMSALQHFDLETGGVPFLVIGDTYLIGSIDIPEVFPSLIELHLAQGGVGWPSIPGLANALALAQPVVTDEPIETMPADSTIAQTTSPTPSPGMNLSGDQTSLWTNFNRDPVGNSLSVIVLTFMILSLISSIFMLWSESDFYQRKPAYIQRMRWVFPVLCLIGLGVSGYMAFVETTQIEAVCGPVGDCNTVQQSEYAYLFGFLPIGVLGMAGYGLLLFAWVLGNSAGRRLSVFARQTMLGLSAFGLLFSIYLTFLEPFVIGASCAWCLTSAVVMTALFWLSFIKARQTKTHLLVGKNFL